MENILNICKKEERIVYWTHHSISIVNNSWQFCFIYTFTHSPTHLWIDIKVMSKILLNKYNYSKYICKCICACILAELWAPKHWCEWRSVEVFFGGESHGKVHVWTILDCKRKTKQKTKIWKLDVLYSWGLQWKPSIKDKCSQLK